MRWQLQNIEDTLELRDLSGGLDWIITEPALRKRIGIQPRYGRPGGYVTGDRETNSRSLQLKSTITAEQDSDYIEKMGQLVEIFDSNKAPFYLIDVNNDRRCEIELNAINASAKSDGVEMRVTDVSLDLVMVESYWEDNNVSEVFSESGGIESGGLIVAVNNGVISSYPVIKVAAQAANNSFTIYNDTVEDIITIASNSFVFGSEIIIDCANGTIMLNDGGSMVDISASIVNGTGFIFLAPGENQLRYESNFGAVDISVEWRNKYAF